MKADYTSEGLKSRWKNGIIYVYFLWVDFMISALPDHIEKL